MIARMTSISVPPTWKPTLPPSIRTPDGADHPESVRHDANPRPNLPPTTNAPFFRPGTMTTHCAFFSRSIGMARSSIDMTSSNTATVFSSRATVWACAAAPPVQAAAPSDGHRKPSCCSHRHAGLLDTRLPRRREPSASRDSTTGCRLPTLTASIEIDPPSTPSTGKSDLVLLLPGADHVQQRQVVVRRRNRQHRVAAERLVVHERLVIAGDSSPLASASNRTAQSYGSGAWRPQA